MIGKRLWPYLTGAAVVLAAVVVFLLVRPGQPDLVPVTPVTTGAPTIAGRLTMDQAGATATARVTISADRPVTLRALTIKVRDEAGAYHDFPAQANVGLTTAPQELVFNRDRLDPGVYTYYLAYRLDADWVSLPPWQSITIG
ncbi:hypothetical protein [Amycolatopsis taiwanensis]|uniref:Uncharacterized protein n=1 Tax=Amycolatopsis taiwanensis TaxID=342230 RepID=A0A9W6QY93_9PSEU|nr:hypothetical protein [Amycolatopsis taiwanensis]GLY64180.1 hypothetical protein Atai01_07990 [Amycolatopsis taiwanensis]